MTFINFFTAKQDVGGGIKELTVKRNYIPLLIYRREIDRAHRD